MMGRSHAMLAALGGSLVGHHALGLNPLDNTIFMITTAGFGLLPDLDEPKSTISRQFGPLSKSFSVFTRRVAGGHRNATHSWIFVVIGIALGLLGNNYPWVAAGLFGFSFLLGARTILPDHAKAGTTSFLIGAIASGALIGSGNIVDPKVIIYSVPLGIVLHQLGDLITPQGIPWFWPFKVKVRWVWFTTGSSNEYNVMAPILILGLSIVFVLYTVVPFVGWIQQDGLAHIIGNYDSFVLRK